MSAQLKKTGERMITDAYQDTEAAYAIYLLHTASYEFAASYCEGKQVLDLGCGSGYGAAEIAAIAAGVHAVDISSEAIAFACANYPASNLEFSTIIPDTALPFEDGSFDVVLSFQVIEHVNDHDQYLAEAARVLTAGGVLVLITPDRKNRLFPGQKPWNRWHLREYSNRQLSELTAKYFKLESSLEMGARKDVAEFELKRYRTAKWLTLPVTLPFLPEALRQFGLNLIQRVRPQPTNSSPNREKTDYGYGTEVVTFSVADKNSLNLVIVARAE